MKGFYHLVSLNWLLYLASFTLLTLSSMDVLRISSLNMNGGRGAQRRALVGEIFQQKKLDFILLQETHSDMDNEIDWRLWWRGQHRVSHGTNLSAGVAVLFSPSLSVNILSYSEPIPGRFLIIRVEIRGFIFTIFNIYAPNLFPERVAFFKVFKEKLASVAQGECIVVGGDWNCCTDNADRIGQEPHQASSKLLQGILQESQLVDIWRTKHPTASQYTWMRVGGGAVSAARLDRFYLSASFLNRAGNSYIHPVGFSDHHLILTELLLSDDSRQRTFWHFNIKLLNDFNFCSNFKFFWSYWQTQKQFYTSLIQWWEVGKAQVKVFTQKYSASTATAIRKTADQLEKAFEDLEGLTAQSPEQLGRAKQRLGSFLQEQAKGALVRGRFTSIKDMDAPTNLFFKLGKSSSHKSTMVGLQKSNGTVTSESATMREEVVAFYDDLYKMEDCSEAAAAELLDGLPQLGSAEREALDATITLQELTTAVMQMASGKSSGLDGLPAEFFKHFWNFLGHDLLDVFNESFNNGTLPASCRRAVVSLLPKKGDQTLLKNWRPVALLCTDYKILSKVLANRLKVFMDLIIGVDQSYCVPGRSILDNLFLMRDVFDVCKTYGLNTGIISVDQEKAFDRVDHNFLFATLRAFGLGEHFLKWVKLLYYDVSCVVKVRGGLTRPVPVTRGIRQGCPISGLLYSLAIEPLLAWLRGKVRGLSLPGPSNDKSVVVSAYADDVNVFLKDKQDFLVLKQGLQLFENASSAKVNWTKSEACLIGQTSSLNTVVLPGGLRWRKDGLKVLGVHMGKEDLGFKNWEGVLDKVRAKLLSWKWLLPQLSYRGRVLVINNLVAASLWHKLQIMVPPTGFLEEIQRLVVDFFWSGRHWKKEALLYLPVTEGGQGLIDIISRVAGFRLQAAKRFLYGTSARWMDIAEMLLRKAGKLGLDKQLFLMEPPTHGFNELPPFYNSLLTAWKNLNVFRQPDPPPGMWIFEEPLFDNVFIAADTFSSSALRSRLVQAGILKLGHIARLPTDELANMIGLKSRRVLNGIVGRLWSFLSRPLRTFAQNSTNVDNWSRCLDYAFPSLFVGPAAEEEPITPRPTLPNFKKPTPQKLSDIKGKQLYHICMFTRNFRSILRLGPSKWMDINDSDSSPNDGWRVLYKPPVQKRMADIQWRIIHGIIATNKYRAHFDPSTGEGCPFCAVPETLEHLVLTCPRLGELFKFVQALVKGLGETFTIPVFIFGPKYTRRKRPVIVLINFIFANVKMAIWKSRKNHMQGNGWTDPVHCFKGLVSGRLRLEHAYYKLMENLSGFTEVWAINHVLCSVDNNGSLILKL